MAGCNSCGAPLLVDRNRGVLVCDHCGSQQDAPGVLEHVEVDGKAPETCPLCDTRLSVARLEGHRLLYCERCSGMLIGMHVFAAVIDAVRVGERSVRTVLPRRENPGDRQLLCPACREPMLNHIYAGPGNVVIDSCERCDVNWLDGGELRRIALAPETRRD